MGAGFVCSPAFFVGIWAIVRCVLYMIVISTELPLVDECRDYKMHDSDKWGEYTLYQCGDVNNLDNAIIQTSIEDDFKFLLVLWLLMELVLGICGVLILVSGLLNFGLMLSLSQIILVVVSYALIIVDFAFFVSIIDRYKFRNDFFLYLGQMVGNTHKDTAKAIVEEYEISSLRDFTSHKMQDIFYRCLFHIITLIFACCIQWRLIMSCCRG